MSEPVKQFAQLGNIGRVPDGIYVRAEDSNRAMAEKDEVHAQEIEALKAQIREALKEYGRHKKNCLWHEGMPDIDTPQRCTCGFEDALRGLFDAALAGKEGSSE